MVDMGQCLSAQERAEMNGNSKPFWTPEEEKEVKAIRANPAFWDDTNEGEALVMRLHELKASANFRYNNG